MGENTFSTSIKSGHDCIFHRCRIPKRCTSGAERRIRQNTHDLAKIVNQLTKRHRDEEKSDDTSQLI